MTRSFATGILAVLASATLSLGAVTKFTTFYKSQDEAGDVDGVATMKFDSGAQHTHFTLVLHGLTPGQVYDLFVVGAPGPISVTANNGGNLVFEANFPNNVEAPDTIIGLMAGGDVRVANIQLP
jgi:hypothetical protein